MTGMQWTGKNIAEIREFAGKRGFLVDHQDALPWAVVCSQHFTRLAHLDLGEWLVFADEEKMPMAMDSQALARDWRRLEDG